jgi:hypothetical protein
MLLLPNAANPPASVAFLISIAFCLHGLQADRLPASLGDLGRGHDVARFDDQIPHCRNAFGDLDPALYLVHENIRSAMSPLSHTLNVLDAEQRDISGGVVKLDKHG